jgi:hypothetical protein
MSPKGVRKVTHKRLFCIGEGESFRYAMCSDKKAAEKLLGKGAHTADSDDVRHLWQTERLYELTNEQLEEKFGVSRQAMDLWKKKGGDDLKSRSDFLREQAKERVIAALDPSKTPNEIVKETNVSLYFVKEIAAEQGIELAFKGQKKPDDDEIIRLAEGKTWRELAAACGVTLATLRHYVYGKKDLQAQVCPKLKSERSGGPSHGKVNVDEMVELHQAGWSAYQLSKRYQTEVVTIIYWLKKLGLHHSQQEATT